MPKLKDEKALTWWHRARPAGPRPHQARDRSSHGGQSRPPLACVSREILPHRGYGPPCRLQGPVSASPWSPAVPGERSRSPLQCSRLSRSVASTSTRPHGSPLPACDRPGVTSVSRRARPPCGAWGAQGPAARAGEGTLEWRAHVAGHSWTGVSGREAGPCAFSRRDHMGPCRNFG